MDIKFLVWCPSSEFSLSHLWYKDFCMQKDHNPDRKHCLPVVFYRKAYGLPVFHSTEKNGQVLDVLHI